MEDLEKVALSAVAVEVVATTKVDPKAREEVVVLAKESPMVVDSSNRPCMSKRELRQLQWKMTMGRRPNTKNNSLHRLSRSKSLL